MRPGPPGGGRLRPRRAPGGGSPRTAWTLGRVAAALFAGLIVCSLVAGGLAAIFQSGGTPRQDDVPVGDEAGTGDFERSLREAIADDPDDGESMASLANLLVTIGQPDEAIDWYERALAIRPDDAATRLNFGTTLADAGNLADAEVQLRRLLEEGGSDPDAAFYLAELYRSWNPPRIAEARVLYRRVIEAAPEAYLADRAREGLDAIDGGAGSPAAGSAAGWRSEGQRA